MSDGVLFHADRITVTFQGLRALDELSVSVEAGRVVGLIGPNGAGKTTFIDAISGFTAGTGKVIFDGRDVSSLPPHRRARAGLVRTWQTVELFDDLTVAENLDAVAHRQSTGSFLRDMVRPRAGGGDAAIEEALDQAGVAKLAGRLPGELSHGQRMLVGVARALVTSPRMVCMDEPAAGLDSHESDALGERLRAIADLGIAVLLVDHDMGLVLRCCDEINVIEFGKLIAKGTPAEVRADEAVVAAYLGAAADR